MTTLAEILHQHYLHDREQVILVMQQSGQEDLSLTYNQLVRGAAAYSAMYRERGIQPGEVVVLILHHGVDLVYAFWGAVLEGIIPSIMPFLTEKLVPERYRADLTSLISITRPSGIVTYAAFESEVRAALRSGDSVRRVMVSEQVSEPCEPDFGLLGGMRRQPDNIALLQHSSGTTGLQKGVALSHQAVLNQLTAYSSEIALTHEDVIVSWLPLYHDMGLIAGFLQPVLMGVKLVMMSPFDWVRAPYKLMQAVTHHHGTLSWLPNFAYNFCAQKIRDRSLEGVDLSSWRAVINCSEPMRWESQQKFLARFSPYGLKASALVTCYAMAENVFAVTQGGVRDMARVDVIDREAFQTERTARPAQDGENVLHMLSAGKPIKNTQVKVVSDRGEELPERKVGELALKSDCMLSGYYNRPDETARAFCDGWYLTGDYGYMAEGEVFVSGRKKDLIIVGGKNIYPQDIEALVNEVEGVHPGRVVAFGVFNDQEGTEEVVVVAEVDAANSEEKERIAERVQEKVTRGSAIALRNVLLVDERWLLKTSSGKIARLANRDKYIMEMDQAG